MKRWLQQQLDPLDRADNADPGGQWFNASVIAQQEVADRAAREGLGYRAWPDGAPIPVVRDYISSLIAAIDPSADALLTLPQAAALLGYKPAGLRKLVKRGAIQYRQNGQGPIRFKREWLDDFVASKQAKDNPICSLARKRTNRTIEPRFGFDPALFSR